MKKIFLILFSLCTLISTSSFAQIHVSREPQITFGGITSGSNVSIMQLMDYPELLMTDKTEQIISYEMTITVEKEEPFTVKTEGTKMNQAAKAKLESIKRKEGKIDFHHVLTRKGEVYFDTPYRVVLHFDK